MTMAEDGTKAFKAKLAALKRVKRFAGRRESYAVSHDLEAMFADLDKDLPDPKKGVELVAAFYEADGAILDRCDDSDGNVGDVFRFTAQEYFAHYASRCEEKEWVVKKVLEVCEEDDYGVRDAVIDAAASYLPEKAMRQLIDQCWQRSAREQNKDRNSHWLYAIESLARQLKDAPLYERAVRAAWPDLATAFRIDIARVYHETGNPKKALEWIDSIPAGDEYMADKRDELLLGVCEALGDRDRLAETAWRIFRHFRSKETLMQLLAVIGKDQHDRVIEGETEAILASTRLSYSDVEFLIAVGRLDDAETYLLARAEQLNGGFYTTLLPLAKSMEKAGRLIAATAIYRALLESILARAISKYYTHGVRYLKKLDVLSKKIDNWGNVVSHEGYKAELLRIHARKAGFWSKYGE